MRAVVIAAVTAVLLACAAALPRGVAPQDAGRYVEGSSFTCFDGSRTISFSAVNDDFCDCADGSDEPGTSACPNGRFFCANAGHTSMVLLSSRVNDGICDCCDGSDEFEGMATCQNTCEEAGRAAREAAERERRQLIEGSRIRDTLVASAGAKLEEKRTRKEQLQHDVADLEGKVSELEQKKNDAEGPEREAKDQFDKQWEHTLNARRERAKRTLFDYLDVNKDNMLDASDLVQFLEFDSNEDEAVSSEEAEDILDMNGDGTLDDNEIAVVFEDFAENIFEEIKDKFASTDNVEVQVDETKPEYDDSIKELIQTADEARRAYNDAKADKSSKQSELDRLDRELKIDAGPDGAFVPMMKECFSYTDREYKFELCLFEKVTQSPKNGGRSTSLGNWGRWEDDYNTMVYDNGERCWNGPSRSTKVTLVCGPENSVLDASEPNRCEYAMTFQTPAVCVLPPGEGHAQHDEL